mgnify:FL=1
MTIERNELNSQLNMSPGYTLSDKDRWGRGGTINKYVVDKVV